MKAWNVHDAVIEMKFMGKYHTHPSRAVGERGTVINTILSTDLQALKKFL